MEYIFTGIQYIIDAFGYLMGAPIKEKKRRKIKWPRYVSTAKGIRKTKQALGDHRRRMAQSPIGKYFWS